MNYELAKKLKDAGFPQKPPLVRRPYLPAKKFGEINLNNLERDDGVYLPTLEELIDACGDGFKKLWRHSNGVFTAHTGTKTGRDGKCSTGKTPEEAVSELWLALNKK